MKIFELDSCLECPDVISTVKCKRMNIWFDFTDRSKIQYGGFPEWCPLEEYIEKENKL